MAERPLLNWPMRSGRYATEQRLRLVDFLVHQYGSINRSALVDFFGISTPQASADLRLYQQLAPGNIFYDGSGKAYVRAPSFKRLFP